MGWDWILHPVVPYALTGTGLGLCTYLFLTVIRDLRRLSQKCLDRHQALEQECAAIHETLAQVQKELAELQQHGAMLVEPPPATSGLNISKRTQALRMYRRGEPADKIAAALALPLQEVELMLKVESLESAET